MNTRSLLVALPLLALPMAVAVASCGGPDSPAGGEGGSYPAGSGGFNPGGTGQGGNGAGANGGNGGLGGTNEAGVDVIEEPGPPVCAEEYKRCPQEFTYPVGFDGGTETSVELRGDFAADGWEKGFPLQKNGNVWTASVPVPMGWSFQYKFLVNGTSWVPDPGPAPQVDDGVGGKNSVFAGTTCTWWSCVTEPAPLNCEETIRTCNHKFQYAAASETSVEVRGDWATDGWTKGVAMTKDGAWWKAFVELSWGTQVQYKYVIDGTNWVLDPANPDTTGNPPNSLLKNVKCGWWSCGKPPTGYDWRDAVMYFAFVDRFVDGDASNNGTAVPGVDPKANYQGGDWAGVLQKINDGYFTDLGINTLWLTVPMDNPEAMGIGDDGKPYSAYHGYWPSDLTKTEERFGSMVELKAVVDAAHGKQMKVILDYAMNHMHSAAALYSQHNDWFWPLDFSDGNGSHHCICGDSSCPWDGQYAKRCWFRDYLPDFNFTNADARKASIDNTIWWIQQTGIDGYRLDAVKHIEDQWVLDIRSRVKAEIEPTSGQHFYMVGETYTGDQGLIKYYVNPSMLDGQFDFPLRARLAQSLLTRSAPMSDLEGFMNGNDGYYGSAAIMSTFIGNHDLPRAIHLAEDSPMWNDVWANGKDKAWSNMPGQPASNSAYERMANAFTILMTTKGIPLIYYGDEIGLAGAGDPDNRRMMQWTGYGAGQNLLLAHLKKLGKIRADHEALRRGSRTTIGNTTSETMAYKMESGSQTVYVLVNRGDAQQSIGGLPSGSFDELLTATTVSGPSATVPPRSSMILVAK
ncbi:MAG: hypothetical protein HY898_33400 [Deltaproteobacteria bacterium]|nr:hypothetical protein [Deltaproteobacteria bacterium]